MTKAQKELLERIKCGLIVVIVPEKGWIFTPYDAGKNPQYRTVQALRNKGKIIFDISQEWSKDKRQSWYIARAK